MSNKNFYYLENSNNSSQDNLKLLNSESIKKDSNQEKLNTLDIVESKVWQGIKLEQEHQLDQAVECYRQAVTLNSRSAVARHIKNKTT